MIAKREKKPIHKVKMTEGKRQIIHQLFQEYDIERAEDIRKALKDLLGGIILFTQICSHTLLRPSEMLLRFSFKIFAGRLKHDI